MAKKFVEEARAQTDHAFELPLRKWKAPTDTEAKRRQAARDRDNSSRWGVVNSPLGIESRKTQVAK